MKKRRILFFLFGATLLCGSVFYGIKVLRPSEDCPNYYTPTTVLTGEEIDRFAQSWKVYRREDFELEDSSLKTDEGVHFPLKLRYELAQNCFTPERFFELEDKLRSALHALYLRKHASAVIDILKAELKTEKDEQRRMAFKEMIDAQIKISNIISISDEELMVVEQKMPLIEKLF